MEIPAGLALLAGFVSFLSPCVLPLVPAYFSYLAGSSANSARGATFIRAFGFVMGFATVFVTMGATASTIGKLLITYKAIYVKVSAIIIIVFGLSLMEVVRLRPLMRERRFSFGSSAATRPMGALILGMAFAAGWTPCVGPVLGSILLYAGSAATVKEGIIMLVVYSIGLAVPFLLAGLVMERLKVFLQRFGEYLPWISRASGLVMVLFGLLIFFDKLAWLSLLIPEKFNF
ncbi:cytochrome c biogenesis CcdA family protein [Calderihabitans maritimus]|uniref:Cytochrome c biogenesis protein transmembrane region n=1 Tax=Calderihabitans maritimus TaxID=1246530 RepID=A0A1Z5HPN9_9FIRM|nr:cytochrome c biogenesis protein CcdA [Calderihabitans maritimus]GAW91250.1 cytochrome c biogenesis protein transmembrane region [Calderihabitans maritimus]